MKGSSKIVRMDTKNLDDLVKSIGKKYSIDVGIIGEKGKKSENGYTIAEIGAVHENGSIKRNIPKRSWLLMPLTKKNEDIIKKSYKKMKELYETGKIKQALKVLGIACESEIQEAFATGGFGEWQALSEKTIKKKGSDSILIDTGVLRKSITSRVNT